MSEKYIVSARKYRPANFHSVVGQEHLTSTLKGAIDSGRLAHAYLFCGPRGVGKTSCARIFAKTINCLSPTPDGEACGCCESCQAIDRGVSFNLMELDAASNNSVNDIRNITDQVNVPPQVGKYRVFIIDEVHMLSPSAFNAFLKTLEEPPSYAIFILATTEKHKVIPTILSRCQIYDFKRITINDIVKHLEEIAEKENVKYEREALGVIALKADGAMRDALSLFDRVVSSTEGNLTYENVIANLNVLDYEYFFRLIDTFAQGDAPAALVLYKEIRDRGFDSLFFVNSLAQHVRDLMVAADPRTLSLLETSDEISKRLTEQASTLPLKWYYAAMKILNDCDQEYRTSSNKQLLVELALIRLCQLMKPAEPPFDFADRPIALRNPQTNATSVAPAEPRTEARSAQQQPAQQQPAPASQAPRPQTASPAPQPQVAASAATTAPAASAESPYTSKMPKGRRPGSHGNIRFDEAHVTVSSLQRKKEPFTDDALIQAWNAYIVTVPEQHILVSAMRTFIPKRTGEEEFLVMVDHPMQQQAFESAMPKLLEFLRTRLSNDFLTLRAEINPDKEVAKFLPREEFLKKAVSANPQLGEFLKSIDIEIV